MPRKRRIAGENRRFPSLEFRAQQVTERLVQGGQIGFRADALAVGRIGHHQPDVEGRPPDLLQRPAFDVQPPGQSGPFGVGEGRLHGVRVDVGGEDAASDGTRRAARARLGAQPLPQRGIMSAPALEAVVAAVEPGRGVGGDRGRLDGQRAGTAHGIHQGTALGRDGRPAGTQQHRGRDVFLEGRPSAVEPVTAPVQALAGKIHRHQRLSALHVQMQQHVRTLRSDVGPHTGRGTQIVANGILQQLCAVQGVADGLVAAAAVAGQGRAGGDVLPPLDALQARAQVGGAGCVHRTQ